MTRMEEVKYLRTEPNGRHYNCAQSLLVPFAEQVGLDKEQALPETLTCLVMNSDLKTRGDFSSSDDRLNRLQQAVRVSDSTAFFLLGELVEYGSSEKVFSNPQDRRTEDYITGRFG